MKENAKVLKHLGVYFLLLLLDIPLVTEILPWRILNSHGTKFYRLGIAILLMVYYAKHTLPRKGLKVMMRWEAAMIFLLFFLQGLKYMIFSEISVITRYLWYLYYIPLLTIPLLLFFAAVNVTARDERVIPKGFGWMPVVTVILIALVLTNDMHQLVFRFRPGFENWDGDYSYGYGFIAVSVWEYGLYLIAGALSIVKCRINGARSRAWLILLPFGIGVVLILLIISHRIPQINGIDIIMFPDAFCFMVTVVVECFIQLGFVPSNDGYAQLLPQASVAVQITDRAGERIYGSAIAPVLTPEQFSAPDGTRVGEHTVLRKMELPAGFGFWQNDVTELDRLNAELAEVRDMLSEEVELERRRNELKETKAELEHRAMIYDAIAERTKVQSAQIMRLAKEARGSADTAVKDRARRHIVLLASYIKRYANLMLLSDGSKSIESGELALALAEVLRYLNIYGIPGEMLNTASGTTPGSAALAAFETFGTVVGENLSTLRGVYARISDAAHGVRLALTVEGTADTVEEDFCSAMRLCGMEAHAEIEDDVTYISCILPEGGERA